MRVDVTIELTGWYRKSARLKAALRSAGASQIEVYPEGDLNVVKAEASKRRGDKTYPLDKATLQAAAKPIKAALRDIVEEKVDDLRGGMEAAGEVLAEGVSEAIRAGKVTGPQRSDAWIERKGQDINMVGLTEDFVGSLKSRVIGR